MSTKEGFMNLKTKKQTASTIEAKKEGAKSYLREFKAELKKVNWTTKAELTLCTKIVIGTIFVFGMGIYFIDLVIKGMLVTLGALFHLIFG